MAFDELRQVRLDRLKAKLTAREGNPAYRENVPALKAEIARLEDHQHD